MKSSNIRNQYSIPLVACLAGIVAVTGLWESAQSQDEGSTNATSWRRTTAEEPGETPNVGGELNDFLRFALDDDENPKLIGEGKLRISEDGLDATIYLDRVAGDSASVVLVESGDGVIKTTEQIKWVSPWAKLLETKFTQSTNTSDQFVVEVSVTQGTGAEALPDSATVLIQAYRHLPVDSKHYGPYSQIRLNVLFGTASVHGTIADQDRTFKGKQWYIDRDADGEFTPGEAITVVPGDRDFQLLGLEPYAQHYLRSVHYDEQEKRGQNSPLCDSWFKITPLTDATSLQPAKANHELFDDSTTTTDPVEEPGEETSNQAPEPAVSARTKWFVKRLPGSQPSGTSLEVGTSWKNPFPDLQQALTEANEIAKDGTPVEIFVAGGEGQIYTPGSQKTDTFTIKSNVSVFGGFPGESDDESPETRPRDANDSLQHVTVLSGANISGDNMRTVITIDGKGIRLDGLTIQRGYAFVEKPEDNPPQYANGGAIYCENGSKLELYQCEISDNQAQLVGGAIYLTKDVRLTAERCRFMQNSAGTNGGAVYAGNATCEFKECVFDGCTADQNGGGLSAGETGGKLTLLRCLVTDCSAADGGGVHNANAQVIIDNSTLTNCKATTNGAAIMNATVDDKTGDVLVLSSTVAKNPSENAAIAGNQIEIHHSIIADNGTNFANDVVDNSSGNYIQAGDLPKNLTPENSNKAGGSPFAEEVALADNGGPTKTLALYAVSPASQIALAQLQVSSTFKEYMDVRNADFDQRGRGFPRGDSDNIDAGACQYHGRPLTTNDDIAITSGDESGFDVLENDGWIRSDSEPVKIQYEQPQFGTITEKTAFPHRPGRPRLVYKLKSDCSNFIGRDSFTYTIKQKDVESAEATVHVWVLPKRDSATPYTITVNSSQDDEGFGGLDITLREALGIAARTPEDDTVDFASTLFPSEANKMTIRLSDQALAFPAARNGDAKAEAKGDLIIKGPLPDMGSVTIETAAGSRAFDFGSGSVDYGSAVTLQWLTITGNPVFAAANETPSVSQTSGGIAVHGGTLDVHNCKFHGNAVNGSGGALAYHENSSGTVISSEFLANQDNAAAGAIWAKTAGKVTIANCTLFGNKTFKSGATSNGGIDNATIQRCIFADNELKLNTNGFSSYLVSTEKFIKCPVIQELDTGGLAIKSVGDLRLRRDCGLLIDREATEAIGEELPVLVDRDAKDLAGKSRIHNTAIDIGAYEVATEDAIGILWVPKDGSIADAIETAKTDYSIKEIHIQQGDYEIDAPIELAYDLAIRGAFRNNTSPERRTRTTGRLDERTTIRAASAGALPLFRADGVGLVELDGLVFDGTLPNVTTAAVISADEAAPDQPDPAPSTEVTALQFVCSHDLPDADWPYYWSLKEITVRHCNTAIDVAGGDLSLDGCTFEDNNVGDGACMDIEDAKVKINGSLFANEATNQAGSAIRVEAGDAGKRVHVTNSTICRGYDMAFSVTAESANPNLELMIDHCTIADIGESWLTTSGETLSATVKNSVIPGDVPEKVTGQNNHNFKNDKDPLLGPLRDNGGPTDTMAPLPGSPLVDRLETEEPFADCDQRGNFGDKPYYRCSDERRGTGQRRDIGAVERQWYRSKHTLVNDVTWNFGYFVVDDGKTGPELWCHRSWGENPDDGEYFQISEHLRSGKQDEKAPEVLSAWFDYVIFKLDEKSWKAHFQRFGVRRIWPEDKPVKTTQVPPIVFQNTLTDSETFDNGKRGWIWNAWLDGEDEYLDQVKRVVYQISPQYRGWKKTQWETEVNFSEKDRHKNTLYPDIPTGSDFPPPNVKPFEWLADVYFRDDSKVTLNGSARGKLKESQDSVDAP